MKPVQSVAVSILLAVLLTACGASGPRNRVVMQPDVPDGRCPDQAELTEVRQVAQRRLQALGIGGVKMSLQGEGCNSQVVIEWPVKGDLEFTVRTLVSSGRLELVEVGKPDPNIKPGVYLRTSGNPNPPGAATSSTAMDVYPDRVFKVVMSGRDVKSARTMVDSSGAPAIEFQLTDTGTRAFADYTRQHVGDVLAIVMDNSVLSAPMIQSVIPDGSGQITGRFTRQEADSLASQMSSGAMPVPLKVMELGVAPSR